MDHETRAVTRLPKPRRHLAIERRRLELRRRGESYFRLKIAIFGAFWAAIFTVQRTVLYADHAD